MSVIFSGMGSPPNLKGDIAISDVLLSRAAHLSADLIVAGAYHHSQLREAVVGGVSRELLERMTVSVLMSHQPGFRSGCLATDPCPAAAVSS